jgi:hypothetical protein
VAEKNRGMLLGRGNAGKRRGEAARRGQQHGGRSVGGMVGSGGEAGEGLLITEESRVRGGRE